MSESVIELLQESAERFLKGYLISKGWPLSRIHDLGALIADAQKYDERFGVFADFADVGAAKLPRADGVWRVRRRNHETHECTRMLGI